MKCPHCQVEIHPAFAAELLNQGNQLGFIEVAGAKKRCVVGCEHMMCPSCLRPIVKLKLRVQLSNQPAFTNHQEWLAYPRKAMRPAAPPEVPSHLAEDFNEACLVIDDSAKASAALARRCMQALLRDQGFTQKDLAPAIDAAIATGKLPSGLAELLHVVRNVGNFAAHPMKDTNSGAILPVEPEEAEWNLEVLEGLFDFYYVLPAKNAQKKAALNAKLVAAGKSQIP